MTDLIVIRLIPASPVVGLDFTGYLDGLTITAYDLSFANPKNGDLIGQAQYLPTDLPNNRIAQLQSGFPLQLQSVATAVIEVPSGRGEYKSSDIRLEIKRHNGLIIDPNIDYNVSISSAAMPVSLPTAIDLTNFPDLQTTSLYLSLPSPKSGIGPNDAHVEIPADGTPPKFSDLMVAVGTVIDADLGTVGRYDPANLTPGQARHIAYEIVWNRNEEPLPAPTLSLEAIYTGSGDPHQQERQNFEGELTRYYSTHNAEAEHLAGFIFSLSAALNCNRLSANATSAVLQFPLILAPPSNAPRTDQSRVVLLADPTKNLAGLGLSFEVPADYFYALGAKIPSQVTPDQRYNMVCHEDEQQILSELQIAIDSGFINEPAGGINRYQAARQLSALGTAGGADTEIKLTSPPTHPCYHILPDPELAQLPGQRHRSLLVSR